MRALRLLGLFLLAALVAGGCSQRPQSESREQAGLSDAEQQVARYGLDYAKFKAKAMKDDHALHVFFTFGEMTDGAATDEWCDDLRELLDRVGETRFIPILDSSNASIQDGVLGGLAYNAGIEQGASAEVREQFARRYPQVWARMKDHRIVEAVDEPAVVPGGSKPERGK